MNRRLLLFFVILMHIARQGSSQSLIINEFLTRNVSTNADNNLEYDDWIEIANSSEQDLNLNGYFITDDLTRPGRFQFSSDNLIVPANGFLLVWADDQTFQGKDHLNFNISSKGGVIALFSAAGQLIDSVSYGPQYMNISRGRMPGSSRLWKFFSLPTPGSANNSPAFNGVLHPPVSLTKPGIYPSPVQIGLAPSRAGDSIRYTTNNTRPDKSSFSYADPFMLDQSRVINAIDVKSGYINSDPYSGLYLFRPGFTMPVLAILTDSLNLYGPDGIYTNYDEPWERYCRINYFENGDPEYEANAGLRIQGASSTFMAKKGFRFFFRGDYGTSKFNYPVFGPENLQSFQKLVLKSGYDDDMTMEVGTLLRDALALELWKKTGGMAQLSCFIILYLNNQYWGIYNLRESVDDNFIKAHTSLENFDLVRFRNEGPDLEYGSLNSWSEMYDMVLNKDMSLSQNYEKLAEVLDIDEFANLIAFVQCTQYYSWGWGVSMFRDVQSPGKWHLSIWDADRAFNNQNWNGFSSMETDHTGLYWANNITRSLMKNEQFRKIYSARLSILLQTVFKPENSIAVLDSLYRIIKPEMNGELHRWAPDNTKWEDNVQAVRDFLMQRPAIISSQMYDYLPFVSSIPDVPLSTAVSAWPNPFDDRITIHINSEYKGFVNVTVLSEEGRRINSLGKIMNNDEYITWDGDDAHGIKVPPGLYLLHISTPRQSCYLKIIKK
jgi:spore coat protein CotH